MNENHFSHFAIQGLHSFHDAPLSSLIVCLLTGIFLSGSKKDPAPPIKSKPCLDPTSSYSITPRQNSLYFLFPFQPLQPGFHSYQSPKIVVDKVPEISILLDPKKNFILLSSLLRKTQCDQPFPLEGLSVLSFRGTFSESRGHFLWSLSGSSPLPIL